MYALCPILVALLAVQLSATEFAEELVDGSFVRKKDVWGVRRKSDGPIFRKRVPPAPRAIAQPRREDSGLGKYMWTAAGATVGVVALIIGFEEYRRIVAARPQRMRTRELAQLDAWVGELGDEALEWIHSESEEFGLADLKRAVEREQARRIHLLPQREMRRVLSEIVWNGSAEQLGYLSGYLHEIEDDALDELERRASEMGLLALKRSVQGEVFRRAWNLPFGKPRADRLLSRWSVDGEQLDVLQRQKRSVQMSFPCTKFIAYSLFGSIGAHRVLSSGRGEENEEML